MYCMKKMNKFLKIFLGVALSALLLISASLFIFSERVTTGGVCSNVLFMSGNSCAEISGTESLSRNTAATRTVKNVGRKMVSALESYIESHDMDDAMSDLEWEFVLLDSKEVNAYCFPDGKIVFLEGILKYADTPDKVAVVMGHEMAHALAKHGRNRQTVETLVNLIGVVTSEVVGAKKGETAQALFNLGFGVGSQLGVMLPYSRKQEYEADKIGVYIMQIAGYDINAAPAFWERMMKGNEGSQIDFLSTHPSDEKRIEALKKVIDNMPAL